MSVKNSKTTSKQVQKNNSSTQTSESDSKKSILSNDNLLKWMKAAVPKLDKISEKGKAGKICVIGGSKEYTGAPYFSAMSALLCGADLVHVICHEDAATAIKSYSPDLIVHPVLNKNTDECCRWLSRMDAVVIGPGLGRENVADFIKLIKFVRELKIPLVIDADGLHLISREDRLIEGYDRVILTPNKVEVKALTERLLMCHHGKDNGHKVSDEFAKLLDNELPKMFSHELAKLCSKELAKSLGNVTIVLKGPSDYITNGSTDFTCETTGSSRRCGGQGDVLGGILTLFMHWCFSNRDNCDASSDENAVFNDISNNKGHELLTAAYGACVLTRCCAKAAFAERNRSMNTTNMVHKIGTVFNDMFDK